jgi:hypothetical protein
MPDPEYVAGLPPEPSKVLALSYIPMDHSRDLDALLASRALVSCFQFTIISYRESSVKTLRPAAVLVSPTASRIIRSTQSIWDRFSIFSGS